MRVGIGYDVHRLEEGYKLIVGGVEIPYHKGLKGHSDADVLTHCIMDSLLGAAGLGDIGTHFPDTDPLFKGINSIDLLDRVYEMLEEQNYSIINIDSIIICEKPKMAPYIDKMKEILSKRLFMDISDINIKATTEEKLGFTGEGLGIASKVVSLIDKRY